MNVRILACDYVWTSFPIYRNNFQELAVDMYNFLIWNLQKLFRKLLENNKYQEYMYSTRLVSWVLFSNSPYPWMSYIQNPIPTSHIQSSLFHSIAPFLRFSTHYLQSHIPFSTYQFDNSVSDVRRVCDAKDIFQGYWMWVIEYEKENMNWAWDMEWRALVWQVRWNMYTS